MHNDKFSLVEGKFSSVLSSRNCTSGGTSQRILHASCIFPYVCFAFICVYLCFFPVTFSQAPYCVSPLPASRIACCPLFSLSLKGSVQKCGIRFHISFHLGVRMGHVCNSACAATAARAPRRGPRPRPAAGEVAVAVLPAPRHPRPAHHVPPPRGVPTGPLSGQRFPQPRCERPSRTLETQQAGAAGLTMGRVILIFAGFCSRQSIYFCP